MIAKTKLNIGTL